MDRRGAAAAVSTTGRGFSMFSGLDRWLAGLCESRPKALPRLQLIYQLLSAVILVWFGAIAFRLVGVAGGTAFLDTAFSGLALQTTSPAFFNGTAACVVLLLVAYGLLSLCLVSGSRVLCDAAALYCLFFSQTVPLYQFAAIATPVFVVFLIWAVHRLILGAIVFRGRKIQASVAPVQ